MTSPTGFIAHRGLGGVVGKLERDLSMAPSEQVEKFGNSLNKFNTSRASIFKKESDEHKAMREAAEKVQENMKKLQEGTTLDQKTGKPRPMTENEVTDLLKETRNSIKALNEKTDQYIAHATPNGKEPSTTAGKERLAGARELKELSGQLQAHFEKDPKLKGELYKEKVDELRAGLEGSGKRAMEQMAKDQKKFEGLSKNSFFRQTPESGAYGLNEWEYQAAKVVASSAVTEALANGEIKPGSVEAEYRRATISVARSDEFKKWAKEAGDEPYKRDRLGTMTPDEVRADFVKGMTKDMQYSAAINPANRKEKSAEKTVGKQQAKEKQAEKKAEKKTEKKTEKKAEKKAQKKTEKKVEKKKEGLKI